MLTAFAGSTDATACATSKKRQINDITGGARWLANAHRLCWQCRCHSLCCIWSGQVNDRTRGAHWLVNARKQQCHSSEHGNHHPLGGVSGKSGRALARCPHSYCCIGHKSRRCWMMPWQCWPFYGNCVLQIIPRLFLICWFSCMHQPCTSTDSYIHVGKCVRNESH